MKMQFVRELTLKELIDTATRMLTGQEGWAYYVNDEAFWVYRLLTRIN